MDDQNKILEMRKIRKQFPGVLALNDVDFDLNRGEVHVLMGANGAGKSTLIKVLSGVFRKDSGTIIINNSHVELTDSRHAQQLGVSTIYQHFSQVLHLSVAENLFLGREKTRFGIIDYKHLYAEAEKLLDKVGLKVDVKTPVIDLSISQRQMIEIAKALSFDSSILIMDEPTSALTKNETEKLFQIISALKDKGLGIIYISHRIEELKNIGNRVTVMRDGGVVGTLPIAGNELSVFVKMMVGKDVKYNTRRADDDQEKIEKREALRVENLNSEGKLKDINFILREGEILGLYGLMGSGRTELARAIFGVDGFESGKIFVNGRKEIIRNPAAAVKNGLGFLTEDRLISGLAMSMSIGHNITLPSLDDFTKLQFLLDLKKEKKHIDILIDDLKIRTPNQAQQVQFLSGGNQQKVVFAKWIMAQSKILILDDPTQGIDVEAKEEVHKFIFDFTRKLNRSIILISSELEEIISLCDRVLVIHEGSIIIEIPAKDLDQELIMNYAVGGKSNTRSNHVA